MKMPTGMRALRAQALKAAILNFMDFADQAIPEDDCCMCGDKQDNHTFDSGHAFTPATQYHAFTLRKEVEKYLDVLETDEATTVTHTDLQGNESQVAVFGPSSFPMWNACPGMMPKKLEKWQHNNGTIYTVDCIANHASNNPDYPVTVVYIGPNGNLWAKPLDNFLQKMTRVDPTYNKQAVLYAQATGATVIADGEVIARPHELWKDGDLFVPEHLKDRNGQVALRECKVCGAGESELFEHPVCPGPGKKVYRHG